jgi:peptidoglycan-associated lipoprotein
MKAIRAAFLLVLAAAVVMGGTGCKSRRGGPGAGGDLTGVGGLPLGDGGFSDLGDERFGGEQREGMFPTVYFDYDSATINPAERSKLEQVASYLRSAPGARLIVEGHCDERGSNEYNLGLGERRALAARAHLINLGVEAERVQTVSFGEERPAVMGHDESAWSQNRRAEFVLVQ